MVISINSPQVDDLIGGGIPPNSPSILDAQIPKEYTMSIQTIVTQAVEKQAITAEELKNIRKMLEQLEYSKDDLYAVADLTEAMLSGHISRV